MAATFRELRCRLEKSGHSRVLVFRQEDGQELLVLPAERLDVRMLDRVESHDMRCGFSRPAPDGTSTIQITSVEGDLLFQQKVWIGAATWNPVPRK